METSKGTHSVIPLNEDINVLGFRFYVEDHWHLG